jgi:hypothetical protein
MKFRLDYEFEPIYINSQEFRSKLFQVNLFINYCWSSEEYTYIVQFQCFFIDADVLYFVMFTTRVEKIKNIFRI